MTAQQEPAIRTDSLTKRYGSVLAVDALSLTVERGEIFGFLGPNGSGKTTTMRLLLGLAQPTAGDAWILGMPVSTELPAILQRVGSLIEYPAFYPFLSGRENLRLAAKLAGAPASRVEEVLDIVDMREVANRAYKGYSLGMKQRIGVAAAIVGRPDLLILDEPANGLDPAGIVEMRDLMRRLKAEGHTVFVSSHVLHEIEQVCDRIAILNRGKVVAQGPVHLLLGGGNRVEIHIANPSRAAAVLRALPWVEDVSTNGNTLVVQAPSARSAELNRALAEEGLYAAAIQVREETLEQYFLDVTGEKV